MFTELELQNIRAIEHDIEEYATNLRCKLEELAEMVRKEWEKPYDNDTYYAPNCDGDSMGYEDIQDLADQVSEIEDMFNKE